MPYYIAAAFRNSFRGLHIVHTISRLSQGGTASSRTTVHCFKFGRSGGISIALIRAAAHCFKLGRSIIVLVVMRHHCFEFSQAGCIIALRRAAASSAVNLSSRSRSQIHQLIPSIFPAELMRNSALSFQIQFNIFSCNYIKKFSSAYIMLKRKS